MLGRSTNRTQQQTNTFFHRLPISTTHLSYTSLAPCTTNPQGLWTTEVLPPGRAVLEDRAATAARLRERRRRRGRGAASEAEAEAEVEAEAEGVEAEAEAPAVVAVDQPSGERGCAMEPTARSAPCVSRTLTSPLGPRWTPLDLDPRLLFPLAYVSLHEPPLCTTPHRP